MKFILINANGQREVKELSNYKAMQFRTIMERMEEKNGYCIRYSEKYSSDENCPVNKVATRILNRVFDQQVEIRGSAVVFKRGEKSLSINQCCEMLAI